MRNAALILGIIGGLWGMLVGFVSFGYTELLARFRELEDITGGVANPELVRAASLVAPILAIAGGAMARSQNIAAGVLLLVSAAGMYVAFGFGVFTMFPIAMCALGGVLALAARKPDAH
jgi:glucan phosphoethanolaminetransferase (alkaline phosphatase superfamily)